MYGKIFASLYQGTLRGRAHEILVFTNLIACSDQYGVVDKHPRAIAEEVGLTIDETRAAIANLESPDPESRSHENDGARIVKAFDNRTWGWKIVQYAKYRAMRNEEDRREQNRIAQERWRNRNKPTPAVVSRDKPASAEVSHNKPKEKEKEKEKDTTQAAAAALVGRESDRLLDDQPQATAATAFPKTPTIADIQVVFPALLVTRDDRERMATLLRLYEYAPLAEGLTELSRAASKREASRRRVFVGELSDWLKANFTPDADDYRRAGLPVPPEAP